MIEDCELRICGFQSQKGDGMFGLQYGPPMQSESSLDLQLGPFSPPPDFDHGPEFRTVTPRPIPDEFRRGRYARGRRTEVWIPALIGAACFVTDRLPFVQQLSWYLLPLGYLQWIGVGCLVIAALFWLRNQFFSGYLRAVENCEPLIGRVRQVYMKDYWNSQALQNFSRTHFALCANVEYVDPNSGELVRRLINSPDYFQMKYVGYVDPGVKPGDYVSLISLPNRFEKSIQIYGWLGLNPDVDFIRRSDKPLQPMSPFKVLLVIIGLMVMTWLLLGFLYVLGRYMPLDEDEDPKVLMLLLIPIVATTLVSATVAVWWFRRANRDQPKPLKSYGFAAFCGLLVGFVISIFGILLVNGAFDSSKARLVPIRVVQLWHQTILELGVRSYELEFEPYPKGKRQKKTMGFEAMQSFEPGSLAVLEVGDGSLGIRWVREVRPINWQDGDPVTTSVEQGAITFEHANFPQPRTIVPLVILADGSAVPPPVALIPELRQQMINYLQNQKQARIVD